MHRLTKSKNAYADISRPYCVADSQTLLEEKPLRKETSGVCTQATPHSIVPVVLYAALISSIILDFTQLHTLNLEFETLYESI